MSRRSTPQKTADDAAWPIRVCVRVPELGFSGAGIDPRGWLVKNLGLNGFAYHAAGRPSRDVVAFYFRTLHDLQRFMEVFPTLQLADETTAPQYRPQSNSRP